jgi:hypothetical protein
MYDEFSKRARIASFGRRRAGAGRRVLGREGEERRDRGLRRSMRA